MDYKKIIAFAILIQLFFFFSLHVRAEDEEALDQLSAEVDVLSYQSVDHVYSGLDVTINCQDDGLIMDGHAVARSVNAMGATFTLRNIPAGSTVTGVLHVNASANFTGTYADKGYVYNFTYNHPSSPSATLASSHYFSYNLDPSAGVICQIDGNLIYAGTADGSLNTGNIPALGGVFTCDGLQMVAVPYSITNTSSSTRDAVITVSAKSSSIRFDRTVSLASLYGYDYSAVLSDIFKTLGSYDTQDQSSISGRIRNISIKINNILSSLGDYGSSDSDTVQGRLVSLRNWLSDLYNTIGGGSSTVKDYMFYTLRALGYENSAINSSSTKGLSFDLNIIKTQNESIYNNISRIYNALTGSGGISQVIVNQTEKQIEVANKQVEIAEEQVETSKGILSSVTDFFGSFFENLQNFVVHLIIPTEEEITAFFDKVNAWFSDRLGFIWYPFDLMVTLVSLFAQGESNSIFKIPSLSIHILDTDFVLWSDMQIDLDAFGIFTYVRLFTSFMLVSSIVKMAIAKWDEWIGGHNT